jgi:hypothetical protein
LWKHLNNQVVPSSGPARVIMKSGIALSQTEPLALIGRACPATPQTACLSRLASTGSSEAQSFPKRKPLSSEGMRKKDLKLIERIWKTAAHGHFGFMRLFSYHSAIAAIMAIEGHF